MADDGSQLIFWAAPDGASSVEITWIVPAVKKHRDDKRVPRAEATHARVRRWGGNGAGEQVVRAEDADRLVHELEVYEAQQTVIGIEQARRRQARIASLSSRCPHCDVVRTYAGVQRQLDGVSNLGVHVYQCSYCGSIELFRAGGPIDHPLQGNTEPGPGPT
ncbi:MAG TPA: hypothetical protein VJN72_01565 [Gaiellales bacterium]|nr:hypothetical protein [Gaiellales bacterium]